MNKIIVGNQKVYMQKEDVISFIAMLKEQELDEDVIICPSYPYLDYYRGIVDVGAQDVSLFDNGAYTGEVSAQQLQSLGVRYCIVGHSERREYQRETDEEINQKVRKLLEVNITPILCIGEKLDERKNNLTEEVLRDELTADLKDLDDVDLGKIIIAYEPVWAIGTGITPTDSEIDMTIKFIRDHLQMNFHSVNKVLYGGSVSEKNIDTLNAIDSIDGYLIGSASSKPNSFEYIINSQKLS